MPFNDDFAAAAAPDHLEEFGDQITHRPFSDDANDSAVVAIVVWDPPVEDAQPGKGTRLTGKLEVAGDLACDVSDQWVIDDVLYQTVTVGEPQGGLRTITIQRTTTQRRTKGRPVL